MVIIQFCLHLAICFLILQDMSKPSFKFPPPRAKLATVLPYHDELNPLNFEPKQRPPLFSFFCWLLCPSDVKVTSTDVHLLVCRGLDTSRVNTVRIRGNRATCGTPGVSCGLPGIQRKCCPWYRKGSPCNTCAAFQSWGVARRVLCGST